jgi:hypothetical protein
MINSYIRITNEIWEETSVLKATINYATKIPEAGL